MEPGDGQLVSWQQAIVDVQEAIKLYDFKKKVL
jgi:hypothetical protein